MRIVDIPRAFERPAPTLTAGVRSLYGHAFGGEMAERAFLSPLRDMGGMAGVPSDRYLSPGPAAARRRPMTTVPQNVQPGPAPRGFWATVRAGAVLLFKAWTTPQRVCGCKKSRW
jgi:hypothetical protein